jgi:hypothetical protein
MRHNSSRVRLTCPGRNRAEDLSSSRGYADSFPITSLRRLEWVLRRALRSVSFRLLFAGAGSPVYFDWNCEMSIEFAGAASETDSLKRSNDTWPPCAPVLRISTGYGLPVVAT